MARLVNIFVSARYRRMLNIGVWGLVFAVILAVVLSYATITTLNMMRLETRESAQHFIHLRKNIVGTFEALHQRVTARPCSPEFNDQLREIAYLPDGLNEFLYAPGGQAQCSVNIPRFERIHDLGEPDINWQGSTGFVTWFDRDLGFVGLPGLVGTVILQEPFATIVAPQKADMTAPDWMALEVAIVEQDGTSWHRMGAEGIYGRARQAADSAGLLPFSGGALHYLECDPGGVHCVAAEASLAAIFLSNPQMLAFALFMSVVLATSLAFQFNLFVTRYWSFEKRFRRNLKPDHVMCVYQPVMNLETGEMKGCEVLARWRDVDESIVAPDRFIPIVEKYGMTAEFTAMVARRAYSELSKNIPPDRPIQVNFNIFPRDLDSQALLKIYAPFLNEPERFEVVLEIVESDQIPADAQLQIEELRRAGIKTYIDDFGTGYSNMQTLAALSVEGVKLDRSFAMAPDNSMMAQMLTHAVDMIHATGRVMVVEGVETAERLKLLRDMAARTDFVQGYFISRPLGAAELAAFLARSNTGAGAEAERSAA